MATLTIRQLDARTHARLRVRAAENGRSVGILVSAFEDAIVVYDTQAARATAKVLVNAERSGRPMGLADAQVAGICVSRKLVLATRSTRDFATVEELDVVDPVG